MHDTTTTSLEAGYSFRLKVILKAALGFTFAHSAILIAMSWLQSWLAMELPAWIFFGTFFLAWGPLLIIAHGIGSLITRRPLLGVYRVAHGALGLSRLMPGMIAIMLTMLSFERGQESLVVLAQESLTGARAPVLALLMTIAWSLASSRFREPPNMRPRMPIEVASYGAIIGSLTIGILGIFLVGWWSLAVGVAGAVGAVILAVTGIHSIMRWAARRAVKGGS